MRTKDPLPESTMKELAGFALLLILLLWVWWRNSSLRRRWPCPNFPPPPYMTLEEAQAEIDRLLRGDFTPLEFQHLCHNKEVQAGFEAFVHGCKDYQEQLFGHSATVVIDHAETWPLKDVLRKLLEWHEHLLQDHNCDCHGYEELQAAMAAGKQYLIQLGGGDARRAI